MYQRHPYRNELSVRRSGFLLRRAALAAGLLTMLVMPVAAMAGTSGSSQHGTLLPSAPASYQPGAQVWSTSTSVPAPGAVLPFATLDPGAVMVIVTPAAPYHPGDKVWTNSGQVPSSPPPPANGCQRVPSSGYISSGVFASTSYEYSNYWSWSQSSSNQRFHWYIRRLSDDMTLYNGASQGGGGQQQTTATSWRWQVKNEGADPQAWNACYYTL